MQEHSVKEKINILLVDDEPKNLLTLERILSPLGENLVYANSGKEALKAILKQNFALILLDVMMPEIDGYEVAELVRQRKETKETPIIFITAYDRDDAGISRGYKMGAVDYLVKPIQSEILLSKVKVFVDLYRKTLELKRQSEIALAELKKNLELNKTNELLERLKLEAEQFASIASHDLQTPLRHIASYVEVLRMGWGDSATEEQKEALDIIARGTQRMKALIGDLLSLSRIGPGSIEIRRVDLNVLLREVISTVSDQIEAVDADVVVGKLCFLDIDEGKFRQVFQNLISNALKYRHDDRKPRIEVAAKVEDDYCKITVTDNGIGIGKEYFARVFEIFQRLHRPDEYTGTGIGLAICKKIVGLHRGEIWIDSEVGQGSTFFVKVPLDLAKESDL